MVVQRCRVSIYAWDSFLHHDVSNKGSHLNLHINIMDHEYDTAWDQFNHTMSRTEKPLLIEDQ